MDTRLRGYDEKKTVKKLQAKKPLSKVQQQIVDRYTTNKR